MRRRLDYAGHPADVASRFGGAVGFEGIAFAAGWRGVGDGDGVGVLWMLAGER
jgi:hypothetical protein